MKQSKTLAIILILVAAGACWPTSHAQQSPSNETAKSATAYDLTEAESQQWQQFINNERQNAEALQQAGQSLINTPVGPDSTTVHARYQSSWLALNLARSQRAEWLAKLQAKHGCADCQILDNKLTRPKPEGK